jgi:hypothetical protein
MDDGQRLLNHALFQSLVQFTDSSFSTILKWAVGPALFAVNSSLSDYSLHLCIGLMVSSFA